MVYSNSMYTVVSVTNIQELNSVVDIFKQRTGNTYPQYKKPKLFGERGTVNLIFLISKNVNCITTIKNNVNKNLKFKLRKHENKILLGLPEKPSVYWEYRNPKEPLDYVLIIPRRDKLHIVLPGELKQECNYGPDRNLRQKRKWAVKKEEDKDIDHSQTSYVSKLIIQQGHKVDCPATISMKEASFWNHITMYIIVTSIPLLHIQLASQTEVQ